MATITSLLKDLTGNTNRSRSPYMVQKTIDLTAQTISPTGGDVVQCISVPANTRVLHAGFQVVESATMNSGGNATAKLGTTADNDEFTGAFDIDGAADGAYAPCTDVHSDVVVTTMSTLDLTFAGDGSSFVAGKIRVYAIMMDLTDMGDTEANEVDRDLLA